MVVEASELAAEEGQEGGLAVGETVSTAVASAGTDAEQAGGDADYTTVPADTAHAAVLSTDETQATVSVPEPSASTQVEADAQTASASSGEPKAVEADTAPARDALAVALPAEDTLLDDSSTPAPTAEVAAATEPAEAAAPADPDAVGESEGVTKHAPVGTECDDVVGAQEVAEPAVTDDVTESDTVPGSQAVTEPAVTGEVTAEDEAQGAAPAEDAAAETAAADDKHTAAMEPPVGALATSHPSADTFTDSHGSQGDDVFHDVQDEHSKAASPAGDSPTVSE